jgi:hypothetical protein
MLGLGKPLAILTKKSDDISSFKSYQFGSSAQPQSSAPQQNPPQQS